MPQKSDAACVIATLLFLVGFAVLNWVFDVQWAWGMLGPDPRIVDTEDLIRKQILV